MNSNTIMALNKPKTFMKGAHREKVLVVIDMQECYVKKYQKKLIANAVKEIRKAKKKKWVIFVVEIKGGGATIQPIEDEMYGYELAIRVKKTMPSGAVVLKKHFNHLSLQLKEIVVCGVYTDCCVKHTVHGLLKKLKEPIIKVIKKACSNRNFREAFIDPCDCDFDDYLGKRLFLV